MQIILILVIVLAIFFAPQWWVRYTFRRYNTQRHDFPGTGGELAQHLIERFALQGVRLEQTQEGNDHYSPLEKTVRLSPGYFQGKSLTAIAVAAHEVGHALQHHRGESLHALRTRLAGTAHTIQRIGAAILIGMPILLIITRTPHVGIIMLVAGLASMGSSVVMHLITLPVEIDASFNKALPILREGKYIQPQDERAVRSILRAAAWTYVAGSLASLLNLWRWLALLRR